ncbi:MAG: gliding motility-associated C-terminal domain-containing protein, partial [Bacteroidia bacterium]
SHAQIYLLRVTDSNNCSASKNIAVDEICKSNLYLPDAFTPNGDGVNDVFKISGVSTCYPFSIKIFDRWGILVYETSKSQLSWDGRTSSGIKIVEGTYYYILTANGETHKGFVTLAR